MGIYLAVCDPAPSPDEVAGLAGPWVEVRTLAGGALLIDSEDTLSRVYHELKWALSEDVSLLVSRIGSTKLRGQPAGTQTWLRERSIGP